MHIDQGGKMKGESFQFSKVNYLIIWTAGLVSNHQWVKATKKTNGNAQMMRMMNWILWIQALIRMLLGVVGAYSKAVALCCLCPLAWLCILQILEVLKLLTESFFYCWLSRVVGLKGVQPRAADTTATVCWLLFKLISKA